MAVYGAYKGIIDADEMKNGVGRGAVRGQQKKMSCRSEVSV